MSPINPGPFPVLGLIAGNGTYPATMALAARAAGVPHLVTAAFHNETAPTIAELVDQLEWMRVGQLGRLIKFFKTHDVKHAVMVGQIAPKNLFDLRPDIKTLMMLARLKTRNAESLFGSIADELAAAGITLIPATTFLDHLLCPVGHIAGPAPKPRIMQDANFGFAIAKEISRLDIGQTVIVRHGTVLAVEAFEGTNETLIRGGKMGKGQALMVKVSKPHQDFRFDVPVIGATTIQTAADANIPTIAVEAHCTLMLEKETILKLCTERKITLIGLA